MEIKDIAPLVGQARRLRDAGQRSEAVAVLERALADVVGEGNDFLACYLTHDLGHAESEPEAQLRWHLRALAHADAAGGEQVAGFYASLHLNLAQTYGVLGQRERALRHLAQVGPALPAASNQNGYRDRLAEGAARLRETLLAPPTDAAAR